MKTSSFDTDQHVRDERMFIVSCFANDPEPMHAMHPEFFYGLHNRRVFEAMRAIHRERGMIDHPLVARTAGLSDAEYRPYIDASLEHFTVGGEAWDDIVRDNWAQREMHRILTEAAQFRFGHDRMTFTLAEIDKMREKATPNTGRQDSHARLVESLYDNRRIVPTHLGGLDRWLGGFEDGDFVLIAARPSVGKTAVGVTLGYNIGVLGGNRVDWHSCEMEGYKVRRRACARMTGISSKAIRNGDLTDEEKQAVAAASEQLESYPVRWHGSAGMTADAIARDIARSDARVIIVDHIGKVVVPGARDVFQATSKASNILCDAAKKSGKLVIAMSQLNRESDKDKRPPELTDLRNSGDLEQDADIVLMLHEPNREDNINRDLDIVPFVFYGRKVREGTLGKREMTFNKRLQWIYETDTRYAQEAF